MDACTISSAILSGLFSAKLMGEYVSVLFCHKTGNFLNINITWLVNKLVKRIKKQLNTILWFYFW